MCHLKDFFLSQFDRTQLARKVVTAIAILVAPQGRAEEFSKTGNPASASSSANAYQTRGHSAREDTRKSSGSTEFFEFWCNGFKLFNFRGANSRDGLRSAGQS